MQDEKLALANAVKLALSTARDAAQDGGSLPPSDKPARAPRPTANRVRLVWLDSGCLASFRMWFMGMASSSGCTRSSSRRLVTCLVAQSHNSPSMGVRDWIKLLTMHDI